MIIERDLVVKLFLTSDFKRQFLQWDGATVPMKEPIGLLGISDLSKRKICEVVMQTAETYSTIEATGRLVKTIDVKYANEDLKQVADNATQLNSEERTQLFRILEDFEDLFGGTLGGWDIEPVNLDTNPDSKPFSSKYYLLLIIKKETFSKELKCLVEI